MKIDNSIKTIPGTAANGVAAGQPRSGRVGGGSRSSSPAGEKVQLSELSSQLQAVETSLASSGVVDAARVDEIKLAISEGRFKVNSGAVADRLLQAVKEMLHSRKA